MSNAITTNKPKQIYILSAINIHQITNDDLKTEFKIHKLKYPKWKTKTFEDFLKFKKSWNEDKYDINVYDTAYFLDKQTAIDSAITNKADINEAGAYPYIVVHTKLLNCMYADIYKSEVSLFEFNPTTKTYHEITNIESNEKFMYIMKYFDATYKIETNK